MENCNAGITPMLFMSTKTWWNIQNCQKKLVMLEN